MKTATFVYFTFDSKTKSVLGSQLLRWESMMNPYSEMNASGEALVGTIRSEIDISKSGRFRAVFSKFSPSVFWLSCRNICHENK